MEEEMFDFLSDNEMLKCFVLEVFLAYIGLKKIP
jgi:hypothetical protein